MSFHTRYAISSVRIYMSEWTELVDDDVFNAKSRWSRASALRFTVRDWSLPPAHHPHSLRRRETLKRTGWTCRTSYLESCQKRASARKTETEGRKVNVWTHHCLFGAWMWKSFSTVVFIKVSWYYYAHQCHTNTKVIKKCMIYSDYFSKSVVHYIDVVQLFL